MVLNQLDIIDFLFYFFNYWRKKSIFITEKLLWDVDILIYSISSEPERAKLTFIKLLIVSFLEDRREGIV